MRAGDMLDTLSQKPGDLTGGALRVVSGFSEATTSGQLVIQTANGGVRGASGAIHLQTGAVTGNTDTGDISGAISLQTGPASGGAGGARVFNAVMCYMYVVQQARVQHVHILDLSTISHRPSGSSSSTASI